MNTYQTVTGLSITGENLQDAIEKGMDEIANALNLGNSAGYQLHQAYAEYDKNENTVVLHITACGSDTERGYDPAEDVPKPYSIGIIAPEDDCPERLDIEVADSPIFSPFDDACLTSPASIYGAIIGERCWASSMRLASTIAGITIMMRGLVRSFRALYRILKVLLPLRKNALGDFSTYGPIS